MIIFAGIISRIPRTIQSVLADEQNRVVGIILMVVFTLLVVFAIVFVQQGRRNVPVMYPGRRVGSRMSMPVKGTLPLMVNMAGMIPIIFAQSLLTFPAIVAGFFINSKTAWVANLASSASRTFGGSGDAYWIMYFFMVVLFTFFYTDVLFTQQNYGDNLKKVGAQIPGVNRGTPTQKYLTRVQRRVTLPGALFLGLIAVLPYVINIILKVIGIGSTTSNNTLFLVTSAGLLIVVGVVRDTFLNIDAELKLHGYDDARLVK